MMFEKPKSKPKLTPLDNLFINYLEGLTDKCDKSYEVYDFNHPAQELRRFLWELLASNYVELVKNRTYNEEKQFTEAESASARYTLHYLLERFLTLIYPIIPQISSVIAREKGIDLLNSEWPKTEKTDLSADSKSVEKIIEFNSQVWKTKKEKGISLRNPIEGIKIPKELSNFEKDLKACHSI